MRKRIFLCTETKFPRGDAGSNYIQYLALALQEAGWETYVLGIGDNRKVDCVGEKYQYRGIIYFNIEIPKNRIKKYLKTNYFFGRDVAKKLKSFGINENDYFVFYTYMGSYINGVMNAFPHIPASHFCTCCVEWLQPEQYPGGRGDRHYRKYIKTFNTAFIRSKKVLPISRLLEKHFIEQGCKTLCLPIMADPYEYQVKKQNFGDNRKHLIYSGSAGNKDSFEVMLESVYTLSEKDKTKIVLHLTGLNEQKLRLILKEKSDLIDKMKGCLIIHPWMEYEELVDLYSKIDFLLLARENSISNQANFPSKIPEMLSYGIIPICSKVGDYASEYLTNGYDSIIFERCTVASCRAAIENVLEYSDAEIALMSEHCKITVREKFYYKVWAPKISEFITSEDTK